ncbi:hypothetical protein ACFWJT_05175 [Streptomyces sp. NPDC127069]|uniref:hypothetical protein n=1 Tax=Streptomyces sp. NPDC127069 TaxID=3347128 RepID=UPI0036484704
MLRKELRGKILIDVSNVTTNGRPDGLPENDTGGVRRVWRGRRGDGAGRDRTARPGSPQ